MRLTSSPPCLGQTFVKRAQERPASKPVTHPDRYQPVIRFAQIEHPSLTELISSKAFKENLQALQGILSKTAPTGRQSLERKSLYAVRLERVVEEIKAWNSIRLSYKPEGSSSDPTSPTVPKTQVGQGDLLASLLVGRLSGTEADTTLSLDAEGYKAWGIVKDILQSICLEDQRHPVSSALIAAMEPGMFRDTQTLTSSGMCVYTAQPVNQK